MRAIPRLALFLALCPLTMLVPGFSWPAANAQTGEWTWKGGVDQVDQPCVCGTLGTPATGTLPGGRSGAASWRDSSLDFATLSWPLSMV